MKKDIVKFWLGVVFMIMTGAALIFIGVRNPGFVEKYGILWVVIAFIGIAVGTTLAFPALGRIKDRNRTGCETFYR